ncbi:N4-gp56 family major capsid protein [Vibrio sp. 99-8-1]|uniref:N4-gp56 family major capsid protein n=1 Tax=Vibrio sp. 99-8-1 TaxID=2607602 RepID=UPI0014934C63|nr:N4-gp56 family major capsid protein [Vibrio sp. 99-8-1]NOI66923.1 N4-gp56 family major capsid protein [Vibrio sp. 99-8-1]
MSTTVYGDISPRVGIVSKAKFLKHAEPILVLSKFGQTEPVPKNRGQIIKFRRPVPFAPATTPITEGVRPASQKMQFQDVTGNLKQYGSWAEITDIIQDLHEDPILNTHVQLSGEQAAETAEILLWGVLQGGTAVVYANGVARSEVNKKLSLTKLRQATRTLNKNRARKKTSMVSSSANYGTVSIEAAYIAVCHTDLEPDIRDLPGFKSVADYGSRKVLCPEEFGTVENVRFITTPLLDPVTDAGGTAATHATLSTTGTKSDVYPIIVFGQDSYANCPLKGKNSHDLLVRNPGKPEKGDELGQTGSVGWKMYWLAMRLNEAWMIRIEVAASNLA